MGKEIIEYFCIQKTVDTSNMKLPTGAKMV